VINDLKSFIIEIKKYLESKNNFSKFALFETFEHEKNDFPEKSKILLDIDQKIILLEQKNNFVKILRMMSNATQNFDNLATNLRVLHNYIDREI